MSLHEHVFYMYYIFQLKENHLALPGPWIPDEVLPNIMPTDNLGYEPFLSVRQEIRNLIMNIEYNTGGLNLEL